MQDRLLAEYRAAIDWQLAGACRTADPELFFSPDQERRRERAAREAAAKQVCSRCPVRAECRGYAHAVREPYGVWGGLTETQREAARHWPPIPPGPVPSAGRTVRN